MSNKHSNGPNKKYEKVWRNVTRGCAKRCHENTFLYKQLNFTFHFDVCKHSINDVSCILWLVFYEEKRSENKKLLMRQPWCTYIGLIGRPAAKPMIHRKIWGWLKPILVCFVYERWLFFILFEHLVFMCVFLYQTTRLRGSKP